MKNGKFGNGKKVLRAKINMSHSNINMRDPVLYRILFSPKYYYGVEDNYVVISYALVLLVFYMVNEYFFYSIKHEKLNFSLFSKIFSWNI